MVATDGNRAINSALKRIELGELLMSTDYYKLKTFVKELAESTEKSNLKYYFSSFDTVANSKIINGP